LWIANQGRIAMNAAELKKRTQEFALRVIRAVNALPDTRSADVIGKQLVRCATSVGANYRASCRAKSAADFISKLAIVEEEADECIYWMELLVGSGLIARRRLANLMDEASQLVAIAVASINTARRKLKTAVRNPQSVARQPKSEGMGRSSAAEA
jgi:four helix bundle protein